MDERETTMVEIVDEMAGENPTTAVGGLPPLSGEAEERANASPERGREASSPPEAEERGGFMPKVAERSEAKGSSSAGDAPGDRKAELTRGLTALAEDGWTDEELMAFSQDEETARDIAAGRSLESAALRYMRRARAYGNEGKAAPAPQRRAGVPTMRSVSAGETDVGDPITRMSDREFDAFYARAMEKAMSGARVRI